MKVSMLPLLVAISASSLAQAVPSDPMRALVSAGASFAGSNARIGKDICGFADGTIAVYKAAKQRQLPQDLTFEADWAKGWQKAQSTVLGYQENMQHNPADAAMQKKQICAEQAREVKGTR